jgi:hypothetical protein
VLPQPTLLVTQASSRAQDLRQKHRRSARARWTERWEGRTWWRVTTGRGDPRNQNQGCVSAHFRIPKRAFFRSVCVCLCAGACVAVPLRAHTDDAIRVHVYHRQPPRGAAWLAEWDHSVRTCCVCGGVAVWLVCVPSRDTETKIMLDAHQTHFEKGGGLQSIERNKRTCVC